MDADSLYRLLENDFITEELRDYREPGIENIKDYLSDSFLNRFMGVMCSFSTEINRVFTAVFPSEWVLDKIIASDISDALLFIHHPMIWDPRRENIYYHINKDQLDIFREKRISIFNLHIPLDNYGPYSTSVCLAKELDLSPYQKFAPYYGGHSGVLCNTSIDTLQDLHQHFTRVAGHRTGIYSYGEHEIERNIVAVVAGAGATLDILNYLQREGINTLITGISALNDFTEKSHRFAQNHGINILGSTHYTTEKYACIAMCDYFKKLGLPGEFIPEEPELEKL